ncbi:hypothetical protein EN780_03010 [Mesorhizobium sp. M4B.F.Ca.ET.089.01.1.1]|uniref:hypothetical protein n=1 Tax=Mesorhizobium sp. M4B.F.Ca.ET.089.01.1.1 TaxID=2496662 RepID=UPI000FE2F033|nr:hypothetical protein [Mesorhizobium sp. M4B.F.Ca.ET.089.01.1.1]RWX70506.1 hypothetical protein EN780_03010 [Mesorhizobium sp. M4B.F.Ca.ET.089.01.1.1]
MSARTFTKVSPMVWRSPRFIKLPDEAKVGYLYLLTNSHVTSAGVYELPPGYACADLGWAEAGYDSVLKELVSVGLIDHDPATAVILIERWFKHNPPTNDDHALGTRRRLESIPCDRLREKALATFEEENELRIQREAAARAAKAARAAGTAKSISETIGNTSRLMSTRLMRNAG